MEELLSLLGEAINKESARQTQGGLHRHAFERGAPRGRPQRFLGRALEGPTEGVPLFSLRCESKARANRYRAARSAGASSKP